MSPSSRRAWIEIAACRLRMPRPHVALLAEGVDRNHDVKSYYDHRIWSPSSRRAWIEIVPKMGPCPFTRSPSSRRAWIEIRSAPPYQGTPCGSPSSRRAWIEIIRKSVRRSRRSVALLAEGVDRNLKLFRGIEAALVALLAEGVDRNPGDVAPAVWFVGRPPRGGRG